MEATTTSEPPLLLVCGTRRGCGRALPPEAFHRRRASLTGRQAICRECSAAYAASPDGRAVRKRYATSPKGRVAGTKAEKRYASTPAGAAVKAAARRRYQATAKGREMLRLAWRRYNTSPKGRARTHAYRLRREKK